MIELFRGCSSLRDSGGAAIHVASKAMAQSKPRSPSRATAQRRAAQDPAAVRRHPIPRSRWQGPLLAGICFALGYGITQRLLALRLPAFVQLGQGFELRAFPGTSLQSLRLKFGTEAEPVRADLDQQPVQDAAPAPVAADPQPDPLALPDAPSQGEAKSANLGAGDGQAPPAPQLPAPPSLPSSSAAPASKP